jgi:hypothetical protein
VRRVLPILVLCACGNDNKLERRNDPPSVVLLTPAATDVLRQDGEIVVSATVSDTFDLPEDLEVTLTALDLSVPLTPDASGAVFASLQGYDFLAEPLTITVTARDTDGEEGSAWVTVEVLGPTGAPTVTIETPEDGETFEQGAAVGMRGSATDLTTAPDDLVFMWSSDLDGELVGAVSADGSSAVFVESLSVGAHVVTLTATDTDGEQGSDTVTVVIEAEVIEAEPGDLTFSEMMVSPVVVADELGEWVELYNTSGSAIDLGGYSFRDDDSDNFVLEGPLVVQPHDYVVVCAELALDVNGGVPCDGWFFRNYKGEGVALANGEDELVLTRPDGLEIDWLHYDDTWYDDGIGLGLDPSRLTAGENDDPSYWCNQTTVTAPMTEPGTPGFENDACGEDTL